MLKQTKFSKRLQEIGLEITNLFVERDAELTLREYEELSELKNLCENLEQIAEAKEKFKELKEIYSHFNSEGA